MEIKEINLPTELKVKQPFLFTSKMPLIPNLKQILNNLLSSQNMGTRLKMTLSRRSSFSENFGQVYRLFAVSQDGDLTISP